jgi:3D (Asp-Asp-Asp) domain-containing protein
MKIKRCLYFMKRTYIFTGIFFLVLTALLLIPSETIYENEGPMNSWPYQKTNPIPSFEPQHDLFEEPVMPILKLSTSTLEGAENGLYEKILAKTTGYNTLRAQTDSTPCISASGDNICGRTDVVACPRSIPLGTWVGINGKKYECLDRTHARFNDRFDISFDKDHQGALNWGIRTVEVIIYKM